MKRTQVFSAAWLMCAAAFCFGPTATASPLEASSSSARPAASDAIELAQNAPAQPPTSQPATDTSAQTDDPIGNVATLTGTATVTRNKVATPLKLKDDIFKNDRLQTQANSTLGITFNDETTFNLTANANIKVDSFVYEDGGSKNAAAFNIAKGTVAFVAAAVARTGDMKISTPTATLRIRGTTGLVEVPEGAAAAANPNNVNIKLYPDADGRVGHIDVNGRDGSRLGTLTQGASGFTVQRGAGGRFAAVALVISPQQAARDQGIVRQVHAAQRVGRQVVTQRRNEIRNIRRNNPPGRQPGLPKQNGAPGPNGQPQNGVKPNGIPGQPPQNGLKPNGTPGQPPQPARPGQPGLQQHGVPQLQRPGGPARPALRMAPPKQKGKERR